MSSLHFTAFSEHLAGGDDLSGRVFDAVRRDANGKFIRDQYAVIFGGGPDYLDDDRAFKEQDINSTAEYVYTVRSIGVTADACRDMSTAVSARMVGARLTVEGRRLDPVRLTSGGRPEPDDRVQPPLFSCDDEFTLVSRRP